MQSLKWIILFWSAIAFAGEDRCGQHLAATAAMRDFASYGAQMNASMKDKLEKIEPYLPANPRHIVDVGTGTGALAATLAERWPDARVEGIDLSPEMVRMAKDTNAARPNLSFRLAAADAPFALGADAAIYSSILHEVYSYSGDSMNAVKEALHTARRSLAPGGRIIVRDFVKPSEPARRVLIAHRKSDITPGNGFEDFARDFGRPVPLKKVRETAEEIVYETDLGSAYEYLYRKDYHKNWKAELNERYGFWTGEQAKAMVREAGLQLVEYHEIDNPWITANRLEGKVRLLDPASGEPLPYPKYQMVLVASRP